MATNIIGKRTGTIFQTGYSSSERFNCQALKDQKAKKEKQYKSLVEEIERRNIIDEQIHTV